MEPFMESTIETTFVEHANEAFWKRVRWTLGLRKLFSEAECQLT